MPSSHCPLLLFLWVHIPLGAWGGEGDVFSFENIGWDSYSLAVF